MILKSFELNKVNLKKNNIILFYGKNEGLKKIAFKRLTNNKVDIFNYDEKEILGNIDSFFEEILNKSLFDNEKNIVIKRATDKILKIIEEINLKNIENITIFINAEELEKKSKLRSYFEKSKNYLCIAFYPDNRQTLSHLALEFFKEKKIAISQENINLLVERSNGDRETLQNELTKIELFSLGGKKIDSEKISNLTNLIENHGISELIDNCLVRNTKKTVHILNENNFSNEDCVLITRIFVNKLKKILTLAQYYEKNKDLDLTINSAKPPIFWKEKEVTRQQILNWTPKKIKKTLYRINEVELSIKKNYENSINIITNFILKLASSQSNN